VVDGIVLAVHPRGEVREHRLRLAGDGEGEIDVRPLVFGIERGRAGERGTADALVRLGRLDEGLAEHVPIPRCVHDLQARPRPSR
jgi:hypothetical protein